MPPPLLAAAPACLDDGELALDEEPPPPLGLVGLDGEVELETSQMLPLPRGAAPTAAAEEVEFCDKEIGGTTSRRESADESESLSISHIVSSTTSSS